MKLVYSLWDNFCKTLADKEILSVTAAKVLKNGAKGRVLILKHDVETSIKKARRFAEIEHKYGHKGSYYIQASLLKDERGVGLLKAIKQMGHEVSYHHDVMDSNGGDLKAAMLEFENNLALFRKNGLDISTVCQHGNPVIERSGYASNRDFFRSEKVQEVFGDIADIMVDFKDKAKAEYLYFSDAGRGFKLIYDPINNDIVNTGDRNIQIGAMTDLIGYTEKENCVISVHPHRWESNSAAYLCKTLMFKLMRGAARLALRIPAFKRLMCRYYYLAKKI